MNPPTPKLHRLGIHDGEGGELNAAAVDYWIAEHMLGWTNADRTVEAVHLDRVAYLHITPPALEVD
jgi:hypothetical protein